jgi:hypothetical protein
MTPGPSPYYYQWAGQQQQYHQQYDQVKVAGVIQPQQPEIIMQNLMQQQAGLLPKTSPHMQHWQAQQIQQVQQMQQAQQMQQVHQVQQMQLEQMQQMQTQHMQTQQMQTQQMQTQQMQAQQLPIQYLPTQLQVPMRQPLVQQVQQMKFEVQQPEVPLGQYMKPHIQLVEQTQNVPTGRLQQQQQLAHDQMSLQHWQASQPFVTPN